MESVPIMEQNSAVGEIQKETKSYAEINDKPQEECGVVAFLSCTEDVRQLCYMGGITVQNRGEYAAGIAISSGDRISGTIGRDTVPRAFNNGENLKGLPEGDIGMVHVRYGTDDSELKSRDEATMPFCFEDFAFGGNGQLTNARGLAKRHDINPEGKSDFKIFSLVVEKQRDLLGSTEAALMDVLPKVSGSFSGVIMEKDRLVAFRDRRGYRPLSVGTLADGGYSISSESAIYSIVEGELDHHVEPGTIEVITKQGVEIHKWNEADLKICGLEYAYFARADSEIDGVEVAAARRQMGKFLAEDYPVDADVVIPMPDSGRHASKGVARESNLPDEDGFFKNHAVGRTYILATAEARKKGVALKHNPVKSVIENKRVIVVDDSIVRGETMKQTVDKLRDAGADEVNLRITYPPIKFPCFYGMNMSYEDGLIASENTPEEVKKSLGVDSLEHLTPERYEEAVGLAGKLCMACATGRYPDPVPGKEFTNPKNLPEAASPQLA